MPPRLRLSVSLLSHPLRHEVLIYSRRYAATAAAAVVTSTISQTSQSKSTSLQPPPSPAAAYPSNQPPSHRRPEFRKSQLHRQYTSILRTTPLILIFQHNNLLSVEWAGIRRELTKALQKVDEANAAAGRTEPPLASLVQLKIIQTSIFEAALRVVDFFRPGETTPRGPGKIAAAKADSNLTHDLSRTAYAAVLDKKGKHDLSNVLIGPIAVLTFPHVSPEHLKAALSILAPKPPQFPAPGRRLNPGLYDLPVQEGLKKLILLAARVEGKVFDQDQTRWVGGIEGGMTGLRSQLVSLLQGAGASITTTLDAAGKSLYLTLESRRSVLEEEQKGPESDVKSESEGQTDALKE
ncbi:hypothetical protein RJZ56_007949 [Blastomyces dermatitidis]|uniref:Uncharacterized protein n=2 Tax=Blastomyces TaxID=229219 RepID=A0A179UUY9_BLAGS|nr:uncharacterized protein BDBG_07271 [Blastomyces gilchristii SLH14081]XP_045273321.1 uncharacterized protein BDCG_08879 [Blastomyces dermatitidis ER-3]EEQ85610.1 hypothetical protein BDCG_08879 [Blastomyces dermatitidis ER-3]OAT11854.1 hypothetical protein BDBG_07271 [Blastomyces gilchristii SLH14081]